MSDDGAATTPEEREPQATGAEPVADGPIVPDEAAAAADVEVPEPAAPAAEPGTDEPDWHDRYLRSAAELENVRRRARRDAGLAETRGIARLARELLGGLDNLDRAIAHAEAQEQDADHHLTQGIRLVHAELLGALGRVGIEAFDPAGEPFDPHRHEAIAQQPREGVATGTIIEVYQQGYRLGEDVLRPAKVVVAA